MRLYLNLCIALFLFGSALSADPVDAYLRRAYQPAFESVSAQHFANVQGYPIRNLYQPIVQSNMQETKANAGADYINEIKDQVLAPRKPGDEAKLQGHKYFRSVTQGATIGIQPLYKKTDWLTCAANPCRKSQCPGLFMVGADWNKCYGEVFQIYRASGPGSVKVGDAIGLYYPHESGKWFALSYDHGHLVICPGIPTSTYGFATADDWFHCWGEVFTIYARGKSVGDTIEEHDYIMLYYLHERKWLSLSPSDAKPSSCPGFARPPPPDRFEACWGEIFELWLK